MRGDRGECHSESGRLRLGAFERERPAKLDQRRLTSIERPQFCRDRSHWDNSDPSMRELCACSGRQIFLNNKLGCMRGDISFPLNCHGALPVVNHQTYRKERCLNQERGTPIDIRAASVGRFVSASRCTRGEERSAQQSALLL